MFADVHWWGAVDHIGVGWETAVFEERFEHDVAHLGTRYAFKHWSTWFASEETEHELGDDLVMCG